MSSGRDKIWVTVMIGVFYERRAVLRDGSSHEFADDAAEVGRHKHRLQPNDPFFVKGSVDEAEEVNEIGHGCENVRAGTAEWDLRLAVEVLQRWGDWLASGCFARVGHVGRSIGVVSSGNFSADVCSDGSRPRLHYGSRPRLAAQDPDLNGSRPRLERLKTPTFKNRRRAK